jgi:hypothetical protein
MATMVLYCTVPELGGHTNFRNAGVHVKPKKGNGIFFSYIDPEKLIMDNGKCSVAHQHGHVANDAFQINFVRLL